MLPKELRFKNFNFNLFFKEGKKVKNKYFLIYKIENKEKKFSVNVSEKVSKLAVFRNKIKRQIYEIIRLNIEKILPGYYLIIVLPEIKNIKFKEIEYNLISLLNKFTF
jgi:ribonuclease P protein component